MIYCRRLPGQRHISLENGPNTLQDLQHGLRLIRPVLISDDPSSVVGVTHCETWNAVGFPHPVEA